MLFVLTGEVQTGKTRWLLRLIDTLRDSGIESEGVVAPGVWRGDGKGGFEKLGIENRILPDGPTVEFARRAVRADDADGQHAFWEFSQEAIAQVNAHFGKLLAESVEDANAGGTTVEAGAFAGSESAERADANGASGAIAGAGAVADADAESAWSNGPAESIESNGTAERAKGAEGVDAAIDGADCKVASVDGRGHTGSPIERTNVSRETFWSLGDADAGSDEGSEPAANVGRLLVVDELGWMELERGEGLVNAMKLLDRGPTPCWSHALVVVRASLVSLARERFESAWEAVCEIAPNDEGEVAVKRAFGI